MEGVGYLLEEESELLEDVGEFLEEGKGLGAIKTVK